MTTLESYYTKRLKSLLNMNLKETEIKHIFAADYLTFNLQTRQVYIDYEQQFTFFIRHSLLYCYGYSYNIYKYPEIQPYPKDQLLQIYPKHVVYNDSSIIDEDKVSKLKWTTYTDQLDSYLISNINHQLTTDFKQLKAHIYKDEKTQLVIDTEQMLITIDSDTCNFTLDNYYMYIYSASQHYEKFWQYSDIVAHKPVCSTLVLSTVHN